VIPLGCIDSGAAIMNLGDLDFIGKPRLRALLDHFAIIEDPREPWRVAHPLPDVLLLVVCGTICDCDDYEGIAAWGKAHLPFLRRFLPYHRGGPGARWLTIVMNRIDPRTSFAISRNSAGSQHDTTRQIRVLPP
jgi:DDE_Tnp_1-associated